MRYFSSPEYLLAVISILSMTLCIIAGAPNEVEGAELSDKTLKVETVGRLHYSYAPGVILPLRNGKILAFDGYATTDDAPPSLTAADGKSYGISQGMVELFDPNTGETSVLTQMPFKFARYGLYPTKQVKAIELDDGRIFLVGRFEEISRPKGAVKPHLLPIYGTNPLPGLENKKIQLESIAPSTEPQMFGLLYNLKENKFSIVKTPDDLPPRHSCSLNLLPDGRVLIAGGAIDRGEQLSWAMFPELHVLFFDPQTNQVSIVGELQHPRIAHQTIRLNDSEFALFGGWGPSAAEAKESVCYQYVGDGQCAQEGKRDRTCEVELFDVKKRASKTIGRTIEQRANFSAMRIPEEKVFIQGGKVLPDIGLGYQAAECFDLRTGKACLLGSPVTPDAANRMSNRLLRGEGADSESIFVNPLILIVGSSVIGYDFRKVTDANPAYLLGRLNEPRRRHHVIQTPSGRVFVIGGERTTGMTAWGAQGAHSVEEIHSP